MNVILYLFSVSLWISLTTGWSYLHFGEYQYISDEATIIVENNEKVVDKCFEIDLNLISVDNSTQINPQEVVETMCKIKKVKSSMGPKRDFGWTVGLSIVERAAATAIGVPKGSFWKTKETQDNLKGTNFMQKVPKMMLLMEDVERLMNQFNDNPTLENLSVLTDWDGKEMKNFFGFKSNVPLRDAWKTLRKATLGCSMTSSLQLTLCGNVEEERLVGNHAFSLPFGTFSEDGSMYHRQRMSFHAIILQNKFYPVHCCKKLENLWIGSKGDGVEDCSSDIPANTTTEEIATPLGTHVTHLDVGTYWVATNHLTYVVVVNGNRTRRIRNNSRHVFLRLAPNSSAWFGSMKLVGGGAEKTLVINARTGENRLPKYERILDRTESFCSTSCSDRFYDGWVFLLIVSVCSIIFNLIFVSVFFHCFYGN